jgi:hypothetical protein
MATITSARAALMRATVPPAPSTSSSGCGAITSTRLVASRSSAAGPGAGDLASAGRPWLPAANVVMIRSTSG